MREKLISFAGVRTTADLKEALDKLENRLGKLGDVRLKISTSSATSLGSLGRELLMELVSSKYTKEECVFLLWGNAIPCGFTPLDRFPNLPTETSAVFQYYGKWQVLLDNHLKEGQGEYAFDSLLVATACEIGAWKGDRGIERYIQAQLHRLGHSVGQLDGIIKDREQEAFRSMGLQGISLEDIAKRLYHTKKSITPRKEGKGYVVLPNIPHQVYSYGEVNTNRTANGVSISARGTGRIVIDLS